MPAKRATTSAGSASPPQITRRSEVQSRTAGSSRNTANIDGTNWAVVTWWVWMSSARYAASLCPSGFAITIVAPDINGQNSSRSDASKLDGVFSRVGSPGSSR
ncbi:hypothetical protein GCM10023320_59990 [Pseudonocardia adelaidensis]|uniref:Uncharacterized protein n=1 Tax=Pseudonocardia adelaidensis TaxID=648754 RepID=A0ABP9NT19_9PSEU